MAAKYSTIDEYLASADPAQRAALEKIRSAIKAAAPAAEECISYQLPTFRMNGGLIAFGAARNHCALYPMSDSVVDAFKNDLEPFETSKGTIRFQPEAPLPVALIRKIVEYRIAENGAKNQKSVAREVARRETAQPMDRETG